jgi:hypothetical protein
MKSVHIYILLLVVIGRNDTKNIRCELVDVDIATSSKEGQLHTLHDQAVCLAP